jgi:hypothetical protein
VLWRLDVVLPGVDGRDAAVDRLGHPETDARVVVVGREPCSVGEYVRGEVRAQVAVAGTAAQDRAPAMPMRIDQPGHRDHPGRVDELSTVARQRRADLGNVMAVDPQIAGHKLTAVAVQRQQMSAANQI